MKKKLLSGIIAASVVIGVGATSFVVYAQDWNPRLFMQQRGVNVEQAEKLMSEQGIDVDQMYSVMSSGNYEEMEQFMEEQNVNFGQMLPFMKQMHPNLSEKELKDLYESMHGTAGSSNSKNFEFMRNMMNSFGNE